MVIWKAILLTIAAMVISFAFIALVVLAAFLLDRPNQIEGDKMLDRIIDNYNNKL